MKMAEYLKYAQNRHKTIIELLPKPKIGLR